jgi:hypothetical protein
MLMPTSDLVLLCREAGDASKAKPYLLDVQKQYQSSHETVRSILLGCVSTHDVAGPVGIRAIQSILMSATQMNLSHFHTAGKN